MITYAFPSNNRPLLGLIAPSERLEFLQPQKLAILLA